VARHPPGHRVDGEAHLGSALLEVGGEVAQLVLRLCGSALANGASGVLRDLGCHVPVLEKYLSEDNICALSGINALRDNSTQLAQLPMLPSVIPLRAIAGDVTVTYPIFSSVLRVDTQSDLV
jgi:hypothetical protein